MIKLLIIRKANENDLIYVKEIYEKVFNKKTSLENIKKHYQNIELLVAVKDENVVGILSIYYIINMFTDKKKAYFEEIAVKDEYQNQGIGRILLEKAIILAKNNNSSIINLTSNKTRLNAIKMYKKAGFEIVDTNLFKKELGE